jgi:hypothetical protein
VLETWIKRMLLKDLVEYSLAPLLDFFLILLPLFFCFIFWSRGKILYMSALIHSLLTLLSSLWPRETFFLIIILA